MKTLDERRIILDRFFNSDKSLHALGKACKITWFDKFDEKFAKDKYAYFALEEKTEAIEKIVSSNLDDKQFADVLTSQQEKIKHFEIDRFIGEHYYFTPEEEFRNENKQLSIRKDIESAIKELGNRGYHFLQAIVNLHEQGKWDRAYGGATWVDILAEIRKLGGQYPSPRDIAILKSYKLYYKTGSRRYPTHTIPEEIIGIVKIVLKKWKSVNQTKMELTAQFK
jgi:hypothetical protein